MKTLAALTAIMLVAFACKGDNPAPDFPDSNRADAAVDAPTACFDPDGTPANCFDQSVCEPVEDPDFLNGCTDKQCIPFANAQRLPLYNNGNLPPLP
jgi:hypothetical protein